MKIREYIRYKVEDYRAWRRGEKRTEAYGVRGRVFVKRKGELDGKRTGGRQAPR